jgi:hypothetical protein
MAPTDSSHSSANSLVVNIFRSKTRLWSCCSFSLSSDSRKNSCGGAEMRSVMKHAYICGAIRPVRVLRRRFVAFREARLQLALKRKALAGQWNDADDGDYSRLHSWR